MKIVWQHVACDIHSDMVFELVFEVLEVITEQVLNFIMNKKLPGCIDILPLFTDGKDILVGRLWTSLAAALWLVLQDDLIDLPPIHFLLPAFIAYVH
ncbi:hypothetical protein Tco_0121348 [Tanacetum coccineum]